MENCRARSARLPGRNRICSARLQNPDRASSGGFLQGPVLNLSVAPDQFPALARIGTNVTYQAGLNQICAGIEAALRGKTLERPWRPSLEPWDFAPFLLGKRNHFTGRQRLFRNLNEWRSKEAPPALLIIGEPGIGKSAIVAALVDGSL
jgi:hypothetical protein